MVALASTAGLESLNVPATEQLREDTCRTRHLMMLELLLHLFVVTSKFLPCDCAYIHTYAIQYLVTVLE